MIKVIKFWSPSCGPCRMLAPVMEQVIKDYPEFELIDINTDEDMKQGGENIRKYSVRSIPAVFFVKDDNIVKSFMGAKSEQQLKEIFDSIEI